MCKKEFKALVQEENLFRQTKTTEVLPKFAYSELDFLDDLENLEVMSGEEEQMECELCMQGL